MANPTITVLMSCYNASRFLSEAIESVLAQTYADFEFLLINDGSGDDTREIIHRYAMQDARICLIDKPNTGLADSLNVGLSQARGEWTARLDADDIADPTRLEKQLGFLKESPSIRLIGTGCVLIDEHGHQSRQHRYPRQHRGLVSHMVAGRSPFPHSSALFHTRCVLQLGGYAPRFIRSQDIDLWLRISEVEQITCLPDILVRIRKHALNISGAEGGRMSWTFGTAARVCHFIRLCGFSDPSRDGDDEAWRGFTRWIASRMEDASYFERRQQLQRIRGKFYERLESQGRVSSVLGLAEDLLTLPRGVGLVHRRLFGSSLASQLAQEWIEISKEPSAGRSV